MNITSFRAGFNDLKPGNMHYLTRLPNTPVELSVDDIPKTIPIPKGNPIQGKYVNSTGSRKDRRKKAKDETKQSRQDRVARRKGNIQKANQREATKHLSDIRAEVKANQAAREVDKEEIESLFFSLKRWGKTASHSISDAVARATSQAGTYVESLVGLENSPFQFQGIKSELNNQGTGDSKDGLADLIIAAEDTSRLKSACEEGDTETAKMLIEKGVDIESVYKNGVTPLLIALGYNHPETAEMLIAKGVDIRKENNDGYFPLMVASQKGYTGIAEKIIDNGEDIERVYRNGATPLLMAIERGQLETAEMLIAKGVDMRKENNDGYFPLMVASQKGYTGIAEKIIDNGEDIERGYKNGETPLMVASQNGQLETAEMLIAKGANVNKSDSEGATPLLIALTYNDPETAKMLIAKGANVNKANNNGLTPLKIAIDLGRLETAEILITKGADVNKANNNGLTPLWDAIGVGQLEIAKMLIAKGADVNKVHNNGATPLMMASELGNTKIAEILIDNGAVVDKERDVGWILPVKVTAYSIAIHKEQWETVEMLVRKGANSDVFGKFITQFTKDKILSFSGVSSVLFLIWKMPKWISKLKEWKRERDEKQRLDAFTAEAKRLAEIKRKRQQKERQKKVTRIKSQLETLEPVKALGATLQTEEDKVVMTIMSESILSKEYKEGTDSHRIITKELIAKYKKEGSGEGDQSITLSFTTDKDIKEFELNVRESILDVQIEKARRLLEERDVVLDIDLKPMLIVGAKEIAGLQLKSEDRLINRAELKKYRTSLLNSIEAYEQYGKNTAEEKLNNFSINKAILERIVESYSVSGDAGTAAKEPGTDEALSDSSLANDLCDYIRALERTRSELDEFKSDYNREVGKLENKLIDNLSTTIVTKSSRDRTKKSIQYFIDKDVFEKSYDEDKLLLLQSLVASLKFSGSGEMSTEGGMSVAHSMLTSIYSGTQDWSDNHAKIVEQLCHKFNEVAKDDELEMTSENIRPLIEILGKEWLEFLMKDKGGVTIDYNCSGLSDDDDVKKVEYFSRTQQVPDPFAHTDYQKYYKKKADQKRTMFDQYFAVLNEHFRLLKMDPIELTEESKDKLEEYIVSKTKNVSTGGSGSHSSRLEFPMLFPYSKMISKEQLGFLWVRMKVIQTLMEPKSEGGGAEAAGEGHGEG